MENTAQATLKYTRIAPRKVRFVADMIRGLPVREAEAQLLFSARRPSDPILKLLQSAIANAKDREMNVENLVIRSIMVNEGPRLKRWMPRARGAVSPIHKKMSHVTIILAEGGEARVPYRVAERPKKKDKEKKKEKKDSGEDKGIEREKPPQVKKESPQEKGRGQKPGLKNMFRRKSI